MDKEFNQRLNHRLLELENIRKQRVRELNELEIESKGITELMGKIKKEIISITGGLEELRRINGIEEGLRRLENE